jgi:hypothetical protein
MKHFLATALTVTTAALAVAGAANAASIVNLDTEVRVLVVTEGTRQEELAIGPSQTVQFCPSGCFVTLPNGDRTALSGNEVIEIQGGQARIK